MSYKPKSGQPKLDLIAELDELARRSHTGLVVWSVSFLEDILRDILKSHMPNLTKDSTERLFKGYGPLSSMSAKIEICYAFGLINSEHRKQLKILKEIRNEFAHSSQPDLHFDHASVKHLMAKLPKTQSPITSVSSHFLQIVGDCAESLSAVHSRALERKGLGPLLRAIMGNSNNN